MDGPIVGTIGLRFLKHFNFELNLMDSQLCIAKNSATFPSKQKNKFDFWCNDDGQVRRMGIGGIASECGINVGDQVLSVNDIMWNALKKNQLDSLFYSCDEMIVTLSDGRSIALKQCVD